MTPPDAKADKTGSIITFKFRVKDATVGKHLDRHAVACNQVWNFCVATQREAQRRYSLGASVWWPSAFDLIKLCTGVAADLGLHSDTVKAICRQFAASRDRHRRNLRFRSSFGTNRALGWIPFPARCTKVSDDTIVYLKRRFRFWKHRGIEGAFKFGTFVQDARGRWYVTFACKVEDNLLAGCGEIGIDLGLKTLATCSDGREVPALRHYRQYEAQLAKAQRAGNKRRVRAINAKIANTRRHHLHVASTRLASENRLIVVGNVNAGQLAKTPMAKSVLDAGWTSFRHMLRYKLARRHGAVFIEADERWSTQTCSACGSISGPKGRAGLSERQWACAECGCEHNRDLNAAMNILVAGRNAGLQRTEIPSPHGRGIGVTEGG